MNLKKEISAILKDITTNQLIQFSIIDKLSSKFINNTFCVLDLTESYSFSMEEIEKHRQFENLNMLEQIIDINQICFNFINGILYTIYFTDRSSFTEKNSYVSFYDYEGTLVTKTKIINNKFVTNKGNIFTINEVNLNFSNYSVSIKKQKVNLEIKQNYSWNNIYKKINKTETHCIVSIKDKKTKQIIDIEAKIEEVLLGENITEKRGKPTPLGVGWIALYYKNKYI